MAEAICDYEVPLTNDAVMPCEQASEPLLETKTTVELEEQIHKQDVVTKEMEAEEAMLEQQTEKKEESDRKKLAEERKQMNAEMRQQRYNQLQALLSKSTLYTSYLMKRMEKQRADDALKEERKQKRLAKQSEIKDGTVVAASEQPQQSLNMAANTGRKSPMVANSAPGSPSSVRHTEHVETAAPTQENDKKVSGRKKRSCLSLLDYFTPTNKKAKTNEETKEVKLTGANVKSAKNKLLTKQLNSSEDNILVSSTDDMNVKGKENLKTTPLEQSSNSTDCIQDDKQDVQDVERTFNGEVINPSQPELFEGGVLRQYQIDGFSWLKVLYENAINGILADEMGLGKTVQCVAIIAHLVEQGLLGPFLVCAPLSTVPNWVSEFKRFTPKLPVLLYHGSVEERQRLRSQILRKHIIKRNMYSYPVVITSYEIAMNDRKSLQGVQWKYLIVDEGHRIKNFQCRLIQELKLYQSTHKLLLTGTPLQNNLAELWSLLNFLVPEIFDNLATFESWFDLEYLSSLEGHEHIIEEERRSNILHMMHQILTPFMLRRLKCDIEVFIPPKREMLVYAPMTTKQCDMYKSIVDKSIRSLVEESQQITDNVAVGDNGRPVRKSRKSVDYKLYFDAQNQEEGNDDIEKWVLDVLDQQYSPTRPKKTKKDPMFQRQIQLRNSMTMLRKCCNHPYLIEYPLTAGGNFLINEKLVQCSGKLMLLDRMLPVLKRDKHKVLIFSQMTQILDILQDYCYYRHYNFCRLDGTVNLEERRKQIEAFNSDPDLFIFLLSTRAGGLGINLTAADTVVIYDSDWNPQCDMQAQDRCHRIGQTRPVMIYRMVTAGTIDQKIVERAAAKRRLEKMIIHKNNFKKGIDKLGNISTSVAGISSDELLELLRSSDYVEVQKGQDVVSDADLEKLLDRSELYDLLQQQKTGLQVSTKITDTSAGVNGLFCVLPEEAEQSNIKSNGESLHCDLLQ